MAEQYRSDAMAAVHESMEALHDVGAIDMQTLRQFDETCLTPVRQFTAVEVRALRKRENVSQAVLGRYLNVSKYLVSSWERGVKAPYGPALRLLTIIEKRGLQAIA